MIKNKCPKKSLGVLFWSRTVGAPKGGLFWGEGVASPAPVPGAVVAKVPVVSPAPVLGVVLAKVLVLIPAWMHFLMLSACVWASGLSTGRWMCRLHVGQGGDNFVLGDTQRGRLRPEQSQGSTGL